jgi:predicted nuclease with TOPRIM domain
MSYTNASHLSAEHNEWLGKLDFYEEELGILKERLTEIAGKNSSLDARAGMKHFQNQFIVQQNNIDQLKHTVKENAHLAFEDVKQHAGRVGSGIVDEYKIIDDAIQRFEKVVKELRREFNLYLSKWM